MHRDSARVSSGSMLKIMPYLADTLACHHSVSMNYPPHCINVGGFFDNQTSADERRRYLLQLLETPAATAVSAPEPPSSVQSGGQAGLGVLEETDLQACSPLNGTVRCRNRYSNDDLNLLLARADGELQVLQAGDMRSGEFDISTSKREEQCILIKVRWGVDQIFSLDQIAKTWKKFIPHRTWMYLNKMCVSVIYILRGLRDQGS